MANIELKDWNGSLVNGGETVLETALAHGVPFPFSCATGDCGACKARVLCGDVSHDSCPEGILSPAEQAQGYILACRATPRNDLKLEVLNELVALPQARRQVGWVAQQERRAGNVTVLRVVLKKPVEFLAGQFFNLKFDNLPARAYSVASVAGAKDLEFHIRLVPGGKTSTHVNKHDLVGSALMVDGPHGHGYLRQSHEGPIVAIGGGTGLAPMLSIIGEALKKNPLRNIHLYYADRHEEEVYFEPELLRLMEQFPHLQISLCLSREKAVIHQGIRRRYERVTESLKADWDSLAGAKLYIAGSPKLVDAVATVARELDLAPRDLHTDPFSDSADHRLDGLLLTWSRRLMARWKKAPASVSAEQARAA